MIERIWHAWTSLENARAYELELKQEIFQMIKHKVMPGYRGISLAVRKTGDEMEFVTVMRFETLDAVKQWAGEDCEQAVVLEQSRKLIKRCDERAQHYEIKEWADLSVPR